MATLSVCNSSAMRRRCAACPPTAAQMPCHPCWSSAPKKRGWMTARAISSDHSSVVSTVAPRSCARAAAMPSRDCTSTRKQPKPAATSAPAACSKARSNAAPWGRRASTSPRSSTTTRSRRMPAARPSAAVSKNAVDRGIVLSCFAVDAASARTPASLSSASAACSGVGGRNKDCLAGTAATAAATAAASLGGSARCFASSSRQPASSVPDGRAPGKPARPPITSTEATIAAAASGCRASTATTISSTSRSWPSASLAAGAEGATCCATCCRNASSKAPSSCPVAAAAVAASPGRPPPPPPAPPL
mmetsp:Transcript_21279/g.68883  ORF Transcript_21279/g.68883 Transcript_21279/m.68883 type:complete len:305 (-) Transcript_21279:611-1525(-)